MKGTVLNRPVRTGGLALKVPFEPTFKESCLHLEKSLPGKGNRICKDLEGANGCEYSAYFQVVWKVGS